MFVMLPKTVDKKELIQKIVYDLLEEKESLRWHSLASS